MRCGVGAPMVVPHNILVCWAIYSGASAVISANIDIACL